MDVAIRSATPADHPRIAELTVAAYRRGDHFNGEASGYENALRDVAGRATEAELLVAVAGEQVLGSVAVCRPGSRLSEVAEADELEFRMLAVDPGSQGRGVGEALVEACLDRGRELGCAAVAICTRADVSANAQRLYRRLGFERAPTRDWSPLPGIELLGWRRSL